MREGILKLNQTYRGLLSNDLGAIAAFLFGVGLKRYPLPPRGRPAPLSVGEKISNGFVNSLRRRPRLRKRRGKPITRARSPGLVARSRAGARLQLDQIAVHLGVWQVASASGMSRFVLRASDVVDVHGGDCTKMGVALHPDRRAQIAYGCGTAGHGPPSQWSLRGRAKGERHAGRGR